MKALHIQVGRGLMQVPGAHRARRQGPEMGMLLSDLGLRVQGFGVSGFIFEGF